MDRQEIREELLEEINNTNLFVTGELSVVTTNNKLIVTVSLHDLIDSPKGVNSQDSLSGVFLENFLITEIERICLERDYDIKKVIKGVIAFLTECQTSILVHFNIPPDIYDELDDELNEDE